MRKPKIHPIHGIDLVNINFRERWNIVQMGTKSELEEYIKLYRQERGEYKRLHGKWDRSVAGKREGWKSQMRQLRSMWRLRYGKTFSGDKLYRVDKRINRWQIKSSPKDGDGRMGVWYLEQVDRTKYTFEVGDLLMFSHTCELGNHYFRRPDDVACPHLVVFRSTDTSLGSVVEVDP